MARDASDGVAGGTGARLRPAGIVTSRVRTHSSTVCATLTGRDGGEFRSRQLSYDGDARASYALMDDDGIEIRRVEYDAEEEIDLLMRSDDPFAESTARTLRTGRYVSPAAAGL